ncbi:MAG: ATP-binding protein [Kofleriaceae bacterium]
MRFLRAWSLVVACIAVAGTITYIAFGGWPLILVLACSVSVVLAASWRAAVKRGERAERRFSESFRSNLIPLSLVNLATDRFTDVNDAFVRLCGYDRDELVGHTAVELELLPTAVASKLTQRLMRSGIIRNDLVVLRRKDGEQREIELAFDFVMHGGEPHGVSTIRDRTEQRRAEQALQTSEGQLRQTQKMESLGMLASGIAHDFNNLLAVIATNASLLAESVPPDPANREMIDDVEGAVNRAVELTRQLLSFSRKQVTAPVVLDVNALVKETQRMLWRMIGDDIKIDASFEPDLQHVRIDPGYLVQVLMNLTINARDAMPRGGQIAIRTRNEGTEVTLSISDTGCGMPGEVRDRVFEPFFTTKEPGKGTGMGLAVVHGIVEQAGGRIEVDSTIGTGTTFTVRLPSTTATIETQRRTRSTIPHGVETLLVVDDDEFVRRSTARGLRARGFNVVEASTPAAALRALDRTRIDLLLTDVVMPQMDGRELAEVASAAHPHLKILYMSGCVDDIVVRHGVERAEVELIEKPFKSHALASKVRHVLDANLRT